ncbi:Dolichyldiphosphatase [Hexamita inflata]|uniref:Dolichyldiphosphatase n=1 Tax=Hexamita inflata TaxID=28002 RepID=A0AA86P5Q7_9EUKA|nr:Dolichyldiphosphatase [Hexamita inflata]CAI9967291.1 Dolichyldiphosphatase [Hexamita inflata]
MQKLLHYSPYISGLVTFAAFIYNSNDKQIQLHIVSLALQSALNIVLSSALKNLFRQPRPKSADFGFPSAHAMFWSGYLLTYYINFEFSYITFAIVLLLIFVCIHRVTSDYHSYDQVIWGVIFGGFWALLWEFIQVKTKYYLVASALKMWYAFTYHMVQENEKNYTEQDAPK